MNYQLVKQVRENNPLRKASLTLPLRLLTCLLKSGISKVTGPTPISPMLLSNAIKLSLTLRPTSSTCAGRASPGVIFRLAP